MNFKETNPVQAYSLVDENSVPSLILNTESLQRQITCLGKRKSAINKVSGTLTFKPEDQNLNSHLLPYSFPTELVGRG